jgi:hypothetical protein
VRSGCGHVPEPSKIGGLDIACGRLGDPPYSVNGQGPHGVHSAVVPPGRLGDLEIKGVQHVGKKHVRPISPARNILWISLDTWKTSGHLSAAARDLLEFHCCRWEVILAA